MLGEDLRHSLEDGFGELVRYDYEDRDADDPLRRVVVARAAGVEPARRFRKFSSKFLTDCLRACLFVASKSEARRVAKEIERFVALNGPKRGELFRSLDIDFRAHYSHSRSRS
jgi:hypothetical protein